MMHVMYASLVKNPIIKIKYLHYSYHILTIVICKVYESYDTISEVINIQRSNICFHSYFNLYALWIFVFKKSDSYPTTYNLLYYYYY